MVPIYKKQIDYFVHEINLYSHSLRLKLIVNILHWSIYIKMIFSEPILLYYTYAYLVNRIRKLTVYYK